MWLTFECDSRANGERGVNGESPAAVQLRTPRCCLAPRVPLIDAPAVCVVDSAVGRRRVWQIHSGEAAQVDSQEERVSEGTQARGKQLAPGQRANRMRGK